MAGFGRGLALKVFSLQQRTNGGVPGEIMRSARLVRDGGGSKADVETLARYLGVQKGGSKALRQAVNQARSTQNTFAQLNQFAGAAQRGEIGGVLGLAGMGAQGIQSLASNPAFQRAIEDISIKFFSSPAGGAKLAYALRRGAAKATSALAVVGMVADSADFVRDAGRTFLGTKGASKALEDARRNVRLTQFDPSVSRAEKSLAIKRAAAESIENINRGNAFTFGASWARKQAGVDAATLNREEAEILTRKFGGDGGALFKAAHEDALRDAGVFASDGDIDKATLANIKQRIADADQYRKGALAALDNANIALATTMQQEANKSLPGSMTWRLADVWKAQMEATAANRVWAKSQCQRAGPRTGD